MRKQLLASTAALALLVSNGVAQATLMYTVWNGTGLSHNAQFPVPTTNLLANFTDTVDTLNFVNTNPQGANNAFGLFFTGSALANFIAAAPAGSANLQMSTLDSGTNISTFIRITESYNLASALTSNL